MKEEIVGRISNLQGRRTSMEIVEVKLGDRKYKREIVHRPDAAAAIVETHDGRFILVKQFRTPIDSEILEAVAGCVERGEEPIKAMFREIEEETGHKVTSIKHLSTFYVSPGYTDEVMHIFYAVVENQAGDQALDDDERVRVNYRTRREMENMIDCGSIVDGKTLVAWHEYIRQKCVNNWK